MPNPKTVIIAIVGIKSDGAPELAIGVNAGDTVIWQVEDGSGVQSIDGIIDSSSTIQLFDDGGPSNDPPSKPPTRGKSKKWSGTVSNIGTRTIETYSIAFTRDDNTIGTHDPKIITNP